MIKIKPGILKKRKKIIIPLWAVIIISAVLTAASFKVNVNTEVFGDILYISSALAMADGTAKESAALINSAEEYVFQVFGIERKSTSQAFIQKSGSLGDEDAFGADYSSLLKETPEDILKSTEKLKKDLEKGKYTEDGETVEKTFTDDQSTDSFRNVYVRNVTESKEIDIEEILGKGCPLPVTDPSEPVVLIYHTHSTETYILNDNGKFSTEYTERTKDKNLNMIRIGDEITKILKANSIGVIHDRNIYDEVYTGAYEKSREGVLKNLEKYPTITITLDIHRDAIYYDDLTRVKPTAEINGKKAAQMMIIAGAEDGGITDFESWETNLSFAVNLQKALNDKYENIMKPLYFCCRKYNMDATPYSLLIEVGTDVNTLEEAAYSGRLLGDVLSDFIKANMISDNK